MKRLFAGLILATGLAMTASAAEVIVRTAPPRDIAERRPPSPGRDYVWIPGYHNWDGHSHVWVAGRWEQPPHAHARWERHRWVRRDGGYVLVEGRWR